VLGSVLLIYSRQISPPKKSSVPPSGVSPWSLSPVSAGAERELLKRQSLQRVGRSASLV
jgi:hypothetical protein